jgi:type I restriction enzyme M protein
MNMILHDYPTAEIKQGNTLAAPKFKDGDAARPSTTSSPIRPSRQALEHRPRPAHDPSSASAFGTPPAKQGDYAYLLHILRSLKSTGKGACILPHGVLFRGNAEGVIRRNLSSAATSRASSACRPTCSTAPASPPASSCSTRRTRRPARASS